MTNIETDVTCNKVHNYITKRKGKDYAPTTKEMQEVLDDKFSECWECEELFETKKMYKDSRGTCGCTACWEKYI